MEIDLEIWLGSGVLLDKWIRQTEKDGRFSAQSPQRILKTYNAIKIAALRVSSCRVQLGENKNFLNIDQVLSSQINSVGFSRILQLLGECVGES